RQIVDVDGERQPIDLWLRVEEPLRHQRKGLTHDAFPAVRGAVQSIPELHVWNVAVQLTPADVPDHAIGLVRDRECPLLRRPESRFGEGLLERDEGCT